MKHSFLFVISTETIIGLSIFLSYDLQLSFALIHVRGKSFSFPFIDAPARFAVGVNDSGICGALYVADPLDACSSLSKCWSSDETEKVRIALIARGNCAFEDKVRNAQECGFHAAIVYDDQDKRNLVSMIGNSEGIRVHAVFVSKTTGEILKKFAQEEGGCCITPSLEGTAWTVLVISFFSLLIVVSVLTTFFFSRNRRVHWQRNQYHSPSIDTRVVDMFPCFTFHAACSSGHRTGEICAICLEDYRDGETLKVLPCEHEFHRHCVDSWLTKWGTFCPVCKRDMSTSIGGCDASEQSPLMSVLLSGR